MGKTYDKIYLRDRFEVAYVYKEKQKTASMRGRKKQQKNRKNKPLSLYLKISCRYSSGFKVKSEI